MPALPAPANIPVASIAPDLDDDPNCVVGTVLLDLPGQCLLFWIFAFLKIGYLSSIF